MFEIAPDQVGVNNGGAVWPTVVQPARGVIIVLAGFAEGRGVGDHRVHRAGADAPKKPGFPQAGDVIRAVDIRLGDDAHAITRADKLLAKQGNAAKWAVDIGVTCNQDDIQRVPAQNLEFFGCCG